MQHDLLIQKISDRESTKSLDLQKRLENYEIEFTAFPAFWRLFDMKLKKLGVTFNWSQINYASNANPNITLQTPGIYLFTIKPSPTIFTAYEFVMYVGMTDDCLISRLNNGYRTPSTVKNRPNIHRMILDFSDYLSWYYLPLPGKTKAQLEEIESFLIGFFCDPPINRKDLPVQIANAKKSRLS